MKDHTREECVNRIKEIDLLEEAKIRGFKDGITFIDADSGRKKVLNKFCDMEYSKNKDWLCNGWGSVIYRNGNWSDIISEVKELTVQEISDRLGYEVKVVK